jgi:predicted dehydrogenase
MKQECPVEHGVAVVGLGSMGKRRLRCLTALGETRLVGVDPRPDRRDEVAEGLGIPTYDGLEAALEAGKVGVLCISVPPHLHLRYLREAVERRLPAFVEAGVVAGGLKEVAAAAREAGVQLVPSNTMLFHPAVRLIASLLEEGRLGRISSLTHHCGNHLSAWHPWEPLGDLYASRRETGGAREMTVFELRWIMRLMGVPRRVAGMHAQTIVLPGADIDDTYSLLLDWAPALGSLVVDVVARPSTRVLRITGDDGQILWDWSSHAVMLYDCATDRWEELPYQSGTAHPGYDPRIGEQMYIDETAAFLAAIDGAQPFPHDFVRDLEVLDVLAQAEQGAGR